MTFWETITITLITSIVASGIAVWLAFKRFRREIWWKVKLREYQKILYSLHAIKRHLLYYGKLHVANSRFCDIAEFKASAAQSRKAFAALIRILDTSRFLLSPDATKCLSKAALSLKTPTDENFKFGLCLVTSEEGYELLGSEGLTEDVCKNIAIIAKHDADIIDAAFFALSAIAKKDLGIS